VLVTKATPQVQVSATSAEPWRVQAAVSSPEGEPQGNVTFSEGATILGSADIGQGKATLNVSRWVAGSHVITAHYGGDELFNETDGQTIVTIAPESTKLFLQGWFAATPTHSPTFTVQVENSRGWSLGNWTAPVDSSKAHFASATVSLHVRRPAPILLNNGESPSGGGETSVDNYSCDACLGTPPPVPQGKVTFMEGDTLVGEVAMNTDGIATFRPGKLSLGAHEIVASWEGDQFYAGSASEVIHYVVTKTQTKTSILASSNTVTQGGWLTLTGNVGTEADTVNPGGWIMLKDGKRTLARLKLGTKIKVLDLDLSVGVHLITAVYEGDKNCLASKSVRFKLHVKPD